MTLTSGASDNRPARTTTLTETMAPPPFARSIARGSDMTSAVGHSSRRPPRRHHYTPQGGCDLRGGAGDGRHRHDDGQPPQRHLGLPPPSGRTGSDRDWPDHVDPFGAG